MHIYDLKCFYCIFDQYGNFQDLALHAFINEWLLTAIHRLTIYAITDLGKYLSPNFILIGQALVTTIFGTTGRRIFVFFVT